jgi:two-component system sensor histidine kinase/response regulator
LFSIIAHDLRSPIGQLKNSLDLVNKEYMSPETFKQISSRLSSEVDQLHSTLDNLYDGVSASSRESKLCLKKLFG